MTSRSGCAALIARVASWTAPSSSHAPEPTSSFSAGIPKSRTAGTPSAAASPGLLHGRRQGQAARPRASPGSAARPSRPSSTKSGRTRSAASSRVSRTRSRRTGVRRRRRRRVWGKGMPRGHGTRGPPAELPGRRDASGRPELLEPVMQRRCRGPPRRPRSAGSARRGPRRRKPAFSTTRIDRVLRGMTAGWTRCSPACSKANANVEAGGPRRVAAAAAADVDPVAERRVLPGAAHDVGQRDAAHDAVAAPGVEDREGVGAPRRPGLGVEVELERLAGEGEERRVARGSHGVVWSRLAWRSARKASASRGSVGRIAVASWSRRTRAALTRRAPAPARPLERRAVRRPVEHHRVGRPPGLEHQVLAQVDDRLAQHGQDRQGDQRADDPGQLAAEQQREDHQDRVDPQRVAEDERRDDVALELLDGDEEQRDPQAGERVAEQRDEDRRDRAEERPEVRDELHEPEERAEDQRVALAVGEDPEHPEEPQAEARRPCPSPG